MTDRNDALAKKAQDAQVKTIELEKEIEHFKTEFESVKGKLTNWHLFNIILYIAVSSYMAILLIKKEWNLWL